MLVILVSLVCDQLRHSHIQTTYFVNNVRRRCMLINWLGLKELLSEFIYILIAQS